MTRSEIKKAFLELCPPTYREKQDPVWFERVARVLRKQDPQWDTKTVRYLWKDERANFDYWQGISIQKALSKSSAYSSVQPRTSSTNDLTALLSELKTKIKEQDERLAYQEKIIDGTREKFRRLGEFLAS